jgi:phospholipid/cholesterol/gamma-HCH transport system permease protein
LRERGRAFQAGIMSRPDRLLVPPVVSPCEAEVRVEESGGEVRVTLSGNWRVTAEKPDWFPKRLATPPRLLRVTLAPEIGEWDSSLLLFIHEVRSWAAGAGVTCELEALPEAMRGMLAQFTQACEKARPTDRSLDLVATVGLAATDIWEKTREIARFVGECVLSAVFLAKNPRKFRLRDCAEEMQQCGAMALPIVSLIGLLVGLILAYQAAVLMRQFGADIYVADAVGLAMVREMGAMMTAVIVAGRTGAAFAATLGNMRANDEIDALETLGIRAVDFLVIPKLIALALMMPLLALYSNCMGVLGGMFVSLTILDIPPAAYWVQTISAIDLSDVASGLIKSCAFGLLVGLAGCHRGLLAERSAAGVGRAATSAVVMALLLIIVADALFAVAFNILGI